MALLELLRLNSGFLAPWQPAQPSAGSRAFSELGLHRIEAGTLQIDGAWQDHILFRKLSPNQLARPVRALCSSAVLSAGSCSSTG